MRHTPTRRAAWLAAPLLTLALLTSCGGGDDKKGDAAKTTAAPTTAAPGTGAAPTTAGSTTGGDAVEIKGFAFTPEKLTVKVGTKVTWTNADPATHTVTADDKSFDSKSTPKDESFSFTFTKAGTFEYHCDIHPTMTATVTVE